MAAGTTYRYRFKVDGKVVHCGTTTDLVRREREHRRRWPTAASNRWGRRPRAKKRGIGRDSRPSSGSAPLPDAFA